MAWLPFFVAFVSIPLNIFVPNLIEFNYDLSVAAPFLAAGAVSFVILMGLRFFNLRWRRRVAVGLFYLGAYLLLSDVLAPLRWDILEAENKIPQPWHQTVVELVLAAALILCWAKLPTKPIKAFGIPLILILVAAQAINLFSGWEARSSYIAREAQAAVPAPKTPAASAARIRGNVYHVVFDGYSTLAFPDAARQLDLNDTLEGFTYFENTLSNYESTTSSVPSFLVGRFYADGSLEEWQRQAKDGGLRRKLQESGYEISVYAPEKTRIWMYNGASRVRTSQEISQSYVRGSAELRLAQVSLIRLAPSALRVETFRQTDWRFGKIVAWLNDRPNLGVHGFSRYGFYQRLSVPLIRQFIADEKERGAKGNYIYMHVLLPHENRVWDAGCNYVEKAAYGEQTLCAARLMKDIVAELKRLGRYDDSLIIFQSDHGSHHPEAGEPGPAFAPPPQDIKDRVHAVVSPVFDADGYFRRIHPLLLIRPPAAGPAPLRVSRAPAQLVDIPATVYAVLGIEAPATDGRSVFDLGESEPREIHLYPGSVTTQARAGGVLGKETTFVHISYTPGRGWRAYPDIPVRLD